MIKTLYKNKTGFFVIFFFIHIISCTQSINIKEKITRKKIKLEIMDNFEKNQYYHFYFENINDKSNSSGLVKENNENIHEIVIELFPGIYNIYCYGLAEKTGKTKKVFSFQTLTEIEIFREKEFKIKTRKLYPEFDLHINEDSNSVKLLINMQELNNFFSVSTISIKQGSNRNKTVNYSYNKIEKKYEAIISIEKTGDWYLNISYSLKSKKDKRCLKNNNIKISTNYFKDIYLCTINNNITP